MASMMASTLAGSRPSEKLGTHSTRVLGMGGRITGGGRVRQLYLPRSVGPGGGARLCVEFRGAENLTIRSGNRQTAKLYSERYFELCGVHLDFPAAGLLVDSPA